MFKNATILAAAILAVAVTANVVPRVVHPRVVNVTYVGNNLHIGRRTTDDWLQRTYTINVPASATGIVNTTLSIITYFNLTYVQAIDRALSTAVGAFPTLISGGPGLYNTTLSFTSKLRQPINFTVNTYVRY